MPFIQIPLGDAKEPEVQPEGVYNLTILKADPAHIGKSSGKESMEFIIGFEDVVAAKNIFHYCSLPNAGDDAETRNVKLVMLTRFLTTFGIPFTPEGFDIEASIGARARTSVAVETGPNGLDQNKLSFKKVK